MDDKMKLKQWTDINEIELKHLYYEQNLSDQAIAEIYGVTKNQVRYKRSKYDISIRNKIIDDFTSYDNELFRDLNNDSKNRLLKSENIDSVAKSLTHHIFRNGPVEDMHAAGQLSEEDMKTLNKYMVNRLAGILLAVYENKWLQLELLHEFLKRFGDEWDPAEPDMEDLDLIWEENINLIKNNLNIKKWFIIIFYG